jgi:Tfp pilus assembly protein PilO
MKISKEKRIHLVIVSVVTLVIVGALWNFLIGAQYAKLKEISEKIEQARGKQRGMEKAVKTAGQIEEDFDVASEKMKEIEKEMASGDSYAWMYNTIKDFKSGYRVEIPQFSSVEVSDCSLIYKFPYKQVRMTISGGGFFHDFGKFVADFENHFPHMRLQNLEVSPAGGTGERDREKLTFRMDIIALVKPTDAK